MARKGKSTEEIIAALPDAKLVVIENAGHVVLLEHPEATNAAIEAFLRRVV